MQTDPNEVGQRWAQKLGGSTDKMKRGAERVTVAPQAAALAKADQWQMKMSLPQTLQRYKDGLNRSTLEDWKRGYIDKGLGRVASGANTAMPKFIKFMTSFLPHVNSVAQQVRQMPKVTLEDGIARATAQIRGNAAFKRS